MENKKPTQTQRVIDYVKRFGSITAYEAMKELGVMRLAARISEIEDKEITVHRKTESHYNRFGERVYCTRYSFEVPDGV